MCLQLDLECRVPHGDLIYSYNLLYIGSKALMGTSKKLVFKQKKVRLIMTGYIVVGKNNCGYKYGGIAEKPPKVCLSV